MWPLDHKPMLPPGFCLSLKGQTERDRPSKQIQSRDQTDPNAEPDNKLDSLNSRIFKTEITPIISNMSNTVLLPKN